MKKNKKSVSEKNTKSFLGNYRGISNKTFFVPAANLNANDEIFTDLHDAPSNFSPSNQDPNWDFDISNKIFSESNKKKIFSDDKFKNMINYNQDRYTENIFSDYFVPVDNYYGAVSDVSPVLSELENPRYQSDVDLQSPSRLYGDTFMNAEVIRQGKQSNSDYFNNPNLFDYSNKYQTEPIGVEIPRYQSDIDLEPVSVGIAPIDANYFAPSDDVIFAASRKEGYTMPTEVQIPRYQSDIDLQPVSVGRGYADGIYLPDADVREVTQYKLGDFVPREVNNVVPMPVDSNYFPDMEVREIFSPSAYETIQKSVPTDKTNPSIEQIKTLGISEADFSRFSDEDLIKIIGQEEFDRVVASRFREGMLISPPPTPEMEMGDVAVQNAADTKSDTNNVSTASTQPTTIKDDTKAKKPFNWLPIILLAAVGGYMYYNRKK